MEGGWKGIVSTIILDSCASTTVNCGLNKDKKYLPVIVKVGDIRKKPQELKQNFNNGAKADWLKGKQHYVLILT